MYNRPDYRKLGGWLMFIFVISILNIISCAYALLYTPSLLLSGGFQGVPGLDDLFPAWYWGVSVAVSLILLVLNILALVFIGKRRLAPFKGVFFAQCGVAVLSYLVVVPLYTTGGGLDVRGFYRGLFSDHGELGVIYDEMAPFIEAMAEVVEAAVLFFGAIGLLVSVGTTIAWAFYFKRSKRVAVYFAADYVPPPPPQPQAGWYGSWPGQGYPAQGYPSQGYGPQGYPPQGNYGSPVPPAAPPPAPGAYQPPPPPQNRPE